MVIIIAIIVFSCTDRSANVNDKGEWIRLTNGQECDWYIQKDNVIYGIEISDTAWLRYYEPLEDVDIYSFEVCKGSGYAKDNHHVYYPLEVTCEDGYEFSACYFAKYIIREADPQTFKHIGNGYAVDHNNMFFEGEVIPWDDSKFQIAL